MKRRLWFPFHAARWRADSGLRSCSVAARGLWIECLCLMHEGEPYGHLANANGPLSLRQLADQVGLSPDEVQRLLDELKTWGVAKQNRRGIFYSPFLTALTARLEADFPADWHLLRQEVLGRDERQCSYCGTRIGPFEIDQTVACRPCNRSKGSRSLEQWLGHG